MQFTIVAILYLTRLSIDTLVSMAFPNAFVVFQVRAYNFPLWLFTNDKAAKQIVLFTVHVHVIKSIYPHAPVSCSDVTGYHGLSQTRAEKAGHPMAESGKYRLATSVCVVRLIMLKFPVLFRMPERCGGRLGFRFVSS